MGTLLGIVCNNEEISTKFTLLMIIYGDGQKWK